MRAITVLPGVANSARLDEVPDPPASDGSILVRSWALGVCGTDREIVSGAYGSAPAGRSAPDARPRIARRGRRTAPAAAALRPAISSSASCAGPIRCRARPARPANGTCAATAATPNAASRSGTASAPSASASSPNSPSRSIRSWARSASCSSRPASSPRRGTTSKRIGRRSRAWQPRTLLVTGAGPIGLLAALMGAQRGLDVHVLDRNDRRPEARSLVRATGRPLSRRRCLRAGRHFAPDI